MKTFLNVLYRRILYKIPLKLLLVLLAVFGILFASFSSADNFYQNIDFWTTIVGDNNVHSIVWDSNSISCFYWVSSTFCNNLQFKFLDDVDWYFLSNSSLWWCETYKPVCFSWLNTIEFKRYNSSNNITVRYFKLPLNICSSCPTCPNQYTSLQCQTEYNLIPISSVDSNYCQSNNLCPSCPVCPDSPSLWYSQLYINNILHLWAPNIIMNIPEEIDWDYAYTNSWQNMNIDVVWYNVDYEKIDSIVQFQNYKPSSEDFQKIIWLLAPYTKIIVFFVFLFIVWAWIKKPFKSKKL